MEFWEAAIELKSVVACRCTPTQKAECARAIQSCTGARVCCIGDGGNDVSMIQAADVGIGIVGKEGNQASLAADFSVASFYYLCRLLLWHGRNSYRRTAKLSQFVMHRGFIISIMQGVFSAMASSIPISLYTGTINFGYTTFYTMAPVFSLVYDLDVLPDIAQMYPELYRDMGATASELSIRTFFKWLFIAGYQGGAIMIFTVLLFDQGELSHLVAITFTCLILNELCMVGYQTDTFTTRLCYCEGASILFYMVSMATISEVYVPKFIWSVGFWLRVLTCTLIACGPFLAYKWAKMKYSPPAHVKLAIYR